MNRTLLTIPVICLALVLFPNFAGYSHASGHSHTDQRSTKAMTEGFDPALFTRLQSIDALVNYIDRTFKGDKRSTDFTNYIGSVIAARFYHAYSYYTTDDNWMAALAGNIVWRDLSAIVLPDDIMKHPNAACSQQSIVLIECAKRFGLDYRPVFFDHHYAAEIRINNKWHYLDVDMEVIPKSESLEEIISQGKLNSFYKDKFTPHQFQTFLAHPHYGEANGVIAPRATVFQEFSYWLSEYFFCILFFLQAVIFYYFIQKDKHIIALYRNYFLQFPSYRFYS